MEAHNDTVTKNVLLLYPRTPDTYWSYRHAISFLGKKALMPPLGLLTVAGIMGDGYSYRLVDLNVRELQEADLAWADLAMISAMIVQRESMEAVVRRCNGAGVRVVAGGPYPTSSHDWIEGVDHFVLGEGECTIPAFCSDLERGMPAPVYRPESSQRPDISSVPIPRFDLCDMSQYHMFPLQFSRGCPFDCEFCDIVSLFGHKVRTKDPDQFIREMETVYRTGFRGGLFIVDDNFVGNRGRVKELLRAITAWQQEHGSPFNLSTEASIDLAEDQELLDLMVSAGFTMVFIGLETPVEDSLQGAGKRQNLRGNMLSAVRRIQQAGIEVTGGFIIGFDSDPPDIGDRQIRFVRQLAIPTAMVGLLIALPNTRLWDRLTGEGRIRSRTNGNNTHAVELNFEPRTPREILVREYARVLHSIYSPRHYFARCLKLLARIPRRSPGPGAGRLQGISRAQLRALAQSLLRQGLMSAYAPRYWWFMARAVLRRPRQIVRIVTMAVLGYHYFRITEQVPRPSTLRRPSTATVREPALQAERLISTG